MPSFFEVGFRVLDTRQNQRQMPTDLTGHRPDDGFMRSNMIVYQLRLIEGVVLGRRFSWFAPMVCGQVAVATLTRAILGHSRPSSMLLLRPITPLCLGGWSREP